MLGLAERGGRGETPEWGVTLAEPIAGLTIPGVTAAILVPTFGSGSARADSSPCAGGGCRSDEERGGGPDFGLDLRSAARRARRRRKKPAVARRRVF